jgi:hypothetical protein
MESASLNVGDAYSTPPPRDEDLEFRSFPTIRPGVWSVCAPTRELTTISVRKVSARQFRHSSTRHEEPKPSSVFSRPQLWIAAYPANKYRSIYKNSNVLAVLIHNRKNTTNIASFIDSALGVLTVRASAVIAIVG